MSDSDSVVSGMGCLCAAGGDLASAWREMTAGNSHPSSPTGLKAAIKRLSPVFTAPVGGENEIAALAGPGLEKTRCLLFFLTALAEALAQAGLAAADLRGQRIGICVGTTVGCTLNDEQFYKEFREGKQPGLKAIDRFLANNPAQYVHAALDLYGPVSTINNACTSGVDAIGQAGEWIRDGLCDLAIAGGTDELSRIPYLGFSSLLNTSELPCRPFDLKRDGLNLGEGAGVMIMESRAHARARGAKALVEIAGYGTCGDAYHPTAPHPQGLGLEQAIRCALDRTAPGEISFINAHGTATTANDQVEGSTFARVFGPQVRVFGSKGYTGHTLGAAGAIEAIFSAQGLLNSEIPATAGFSEADPDCAIVPTRCLTRVRGDYALSTSLAFGGNNSALLLKLSQ
jgi:3-oxoacyl-[acyl-carrier-protein] synthase-1/3-oxoacyl-[acyl-carrier-protein] synthase II